MIEIKNNSVYFSEPYATNFDKMYKGVIVVVDNDQEDTKHMHFAIRTNKVKNTIFKTRKEVIHKLSFNDFENTISCDFEKCIKNKTPDFVQYDYDTYVELKENIIEFMKKCGCKFTIVKTELGIDLVF